MADITRSKATNLFMSPALAVTVGGAGGDAQ